MERVASSASGNVEESRPSEENESESRETAEDDEPFGDAVQHDSLQKWWMSPP